MKQNFSPHQKGYKAMTPSEEYQQLMLKKYGPDWREIFRKAQRLSSSGFDKFPDRAREAGKKGIAAGYKKYGKNYYVNNLRRYRGEPVVEDDITLPDGGSAADSS